MVPPLLLEMKSTDLLLDLCAAPGSKTLECLEIMQENGHQARFPTLFPLIFYGFSLFFLPFLFPYLPILVRTVSS